VKSGAAFFRRPRSLCVSVVGVGRRVRARGRRPIVSDRAVGGVLWSLLEALAPPTSGKVIDDDFSFVQVALAQLPGPAMRLWGRRTLSRSDGGEVRDFVSYLRVGVGRFS